MRCLARDLSIYSDRFDHSFKIHAGIYWQLAKAIGWSESDLDPNVPDGQAGEIGIMQVKPDTAAYFGVSTGELRDPDKNIYAGSGHLIDMINRYHGELKKAICAYNAGGGYLDNLIAGYEKDWFDFLYPITKSYYEKVMKSYRILRGY